MCLILKEGEDSNNVKIAVEDISCYKLVLITTAATFIPKYFGLKQIECHFNIYKTFYQKTPITIGNTYRSKFHVTWYLNQFKQTSGYCVEEGLHSFINLEGCIKHYNWIKYIDNSINIAIVKCVIPKGSKYYEGYFENYDSYASDTLKYVEIVKTF